MAFPQSVLPVRVRIAPGGQPAGDPATWVWVDITSDVRVASGILIEQGRADEGARVDPSKCTLTLDNRSGNYSTRNVYGQWYGKIAKNTPLRVGIVTLADTFSRTVSPGWGTSDSGQPWAVSAPSTDFSTNGTAGQVSFSAANVIKNAILGSGLLNKLIDIDAQWTTSVPAVTTGASLVSALMIRYLDNSNFYYLSMEFDVGGAVSAKIRSVIGGVATVLASVSPVPGLTYTASQKIRGRVVADGPALRLKVWQDGGAQPDAWTLTATDTALPDAGLFGPYFWLVAGNTNTKPFVVNIDDLEVESVEFTGAVAEWPTRWDKSRADVTSPIVAAGILRRLQQGKSPLRSPITRATLRANPIAYWPFEDDSSASFAASGLSAGLPAALTYVELGDSTVPLLGAKQTVKITASTVMSGRVPVTTSATGKWGVVWFAHLLAPPAANTRIMTITSSGTVQTWAVDLDASNFYIWGYDSTGNVVTSTGSAYSPDTTPGPTRWLALDLLVEQIGSDVRVTLFRYGVGSNPDNPVMIFHQATVTGATVGVPTAWTMQGSLGFNEGHMAHLAVYNYEPTFVTPVFSRAANGYVSESAASRIARLCAEEGVQVVVEAGTSEPLGPQRVDTFLNLLYSAEDADMGILYERGAGLAYRPRGARYNRKVELALDFALGHIAEPPEPTDDDQALRNQVTAKRDNGSEATASDQTSIDRVGLQDDSVTINVATDDVLYDHANWRVRLGTVDEYRWPLITLDLSRNTGQIRTWLATRDFPRMTIANEPSQVTGNDVDVTVLGTKQMLTPYGWDIELNCVPARPWQVGVYDDTNSRYDSASTTTNASYAAGVTTVVFKTTDLDDVWSTTGTPYDCVCAGEAFTVTTMGAVTGSGPYLQTATVTRAGNGISKTLPAGAPINIRPSQLARYAL